MFARLTGLQEDFRSQRDRNFVTKYVEISSKFFFLGIFLPSAESGQPCCSKVITGSPSSFTYWDFFQSSWIQSKRYQEAIALTHFFTIMPSNGFFTPLSLLFLAFQLAWVSYSFPIAETIYGQSSSFCVP